MKKAVVLINSKSSQANKWLEVIERRIKKLHLNILGYEIIDNPNELNKLVSKLIKLQPDYFIIGGGDGTIITTIQASKKAGFKGAYYIIPIGTSNYLARNLNIKLNVRKMFKDFNTCEVKDIQLASVNDTIFALMSTIGIATKVSNTEQVEQKRKLGQLSYVINTFRQLFRYKSFNYTFKQGNESISGKSFQITVANAKLSSQIRLVPDSSLQSNYMTLTIFNRAKSPYKLLFNVFVYMITFGKFKMDMTVLKFKKGIITTSPLKKIALDGEVLTSTPAKFSLAGTVKILC